MFSSIDRDYLIRALAANKLMLFLGAGFSRLATNSLGDSLPLSNEFAQHVWQFLGETQPYDSTPLPEMYEALLRSGRKDTELFEFLNRHLLCKKIPDIYAAITKPYWYRIYTTNVDDLLTQVYRTSRKPKLREVAFPVAFLDDRDQSLETIQAIYLNGQLPTKSPKDLTFSFRQYAKRSVTGSPLYDSFASDYATHPTIFVGTSLNEPLLWQAIEARQNRIPEQSEQRVKSFLVAPQIGGPRRKALEQFNVIPIEGSVDDFLKWILAIAPQLPTRGEILSVTLPGVVELLRGEAGSEKTLRDISDFTSSFNPVPVSTKPARGRSLYLMGASPRWRDLIENLDAPRDLTEEMQGDISRNLALKSARIKMFAIVGSAGCGKSTILRRIALNMTRSGHEVYVSNSEELPRPGVVNRTLSQLKKPVILMFDNAETILGSLSGLAAELADLEFSPSIVLASRTNTFDRWSADLSVSYEIQERQVPHLRRRETEALLAILDANGLLGRLQGMSQPERIKEFEVRSGKQLLVSMREATSGRLFDDIIRDEFVSLSSAETKILYLCVALATEAGYRLTVEEFVGCSRVAPNESLNILKRSLRDIVMATGYLEDQLILRHRKIAEYMVDDGGAPRDLLADAYKRLLGVFAGRVTKAARTSRTFRVYRDLINHTNISNRFAGGTDQAREIYDDLKGRFRDDPQFWLQYGSLELTAGNLDLAQNYLDQAASLDPGNFYIQTAVGHLLYRQAILAANRQESEQLRVSAKSTLEAAAERKGSESPYMRHILLSQELSWILRWATDTREKEQLIRKLREESEIAERTHQGNRRIADIATEIRRQYLALAPK